MPNFYIYFYIYLVAEFQSFDEAFADQETTEAPSMVTLFYSYSNETVENPDYPTSFNKEKAKKELAQFRKIHSKCKKYFNNTFAIQYS